MPCIISKLSESDIEVKKKIPIFDFHYIQNASHVLETIRVNYLVTSKQMSGEMQYRSQYLSRV